MAKDILINEVIEEIYQSLLATPKRQRRLKSSTFWSKFGVGRRTPERVKQIREGLAKRSIISNIEDLNFGNESREDWITLSYLEAEPPQLSISETDPNEKTFFPPEAWFELMVNRTFESEREVEYFFVIPLLEQLGYVEDDLAIGFPVQMYAGVKKLSKEADIVAFDGTSHSNDNALLIVEAKSSKKPINDDNVGQARSYCQYLFTPYYLVTNGEEIRVYLFRGSVQSDLPLMNFNRRELRQNWAFLYKNLNKSAVLQYKSKLKQLLEDNHH